MSFKAALLVAAVMGVLMLGTACTNAHGSTLVSQYQENDGEGDFEVFEVNSAQLSTVSEGQSVLEQFQGYLNVESPAALATDEESGGCKGWTALLEDIPETVTTADNRARRVDLGQGLSLHICWCWGVRVLEYDTDVAWNGLAAENISVFQDPYTLDLIITDFVNFTAWYRYEQDITSTIASEGTRSHRFRTWSVYLFSNGDLMAVQGGGIPQSDLARRWVWDLTQHEAEHLPVPWTELLRIDMEFTGRMLTNLLPWERGDIDGGN